MAPDGPPRIDDVRRAAARLAGVAHRTPVVRSRTLVAEPSGANALAALLAGTIPAAGLRVGVVLSGADVDAARFAQLVS